jgi:putative endonuclease
MLLCSDLYVGSTSHSDVEVRVDEHNDGKFWGYTMSRRPVKLLWAEWFGDLRAAHARERQLKGWSRVKKLALVDRNTDKLKDASRRRGGLSKCAVRLTGKRFRQVVDGYHAPLRHPEVRAERAPKGGK